jgi:hypothetical protein
MEKSAQDVVEEVQTPEEVAVCTVHSKIYLT